MHYTLYTSPIGELCLVANQHSLLELWLPNQVAEHGLTINSEENHNHSVLQHISECLDRYFAGKPIDFKDLPLAPQGTAFQQAVWQELRCLAYGESTHYGQIAANINNPKAVRAVGGAVGANPIAILLPCHRVLGKNYTLTGFSGGINIKRALLDLEGIKYQP